ncbi:MAG TPA: cory-CC-star protein [Nitrospiria bacterium]
MSVLKKIWAGIQKGTAYYEAVLIAPYRREAYLSYSREEDLFMMICFSELLGLPNPAAYYTLELYPHLSERFHLWHRRMGIPRSPLDSVKCC